MTEIRAQAGK